MSKPTVKLREIERLRAAAVLMVMALHWDCVAAFLPDVAHASWSGVDVFFVISGYVVTLSLARLMPPLEDAGSFFAAFDRAKLSLKDFYTRRFLRIAPAALAVALLERLLVTEFPKEFGSSSQWLAEMAGFFGGIYNYAYPFHPEWKLGIFWTLSVEEHFCLVLPVLFVLVRTTKRRLAACAAVAVLSVVARCFAHPDTQVPNLGYLEMFSSHLRFDSLMAGAILALFADRPRSPAIMPRALMRWVLLPACLVLVACLPGAAPEYEMHRVGFIALWFLSGILVFFASLDQGYVLALPGLVRFLEYIGSRSYALYLTHVTVGRIDEAMGQVWSTYREWIPAETEYPWKRCLALFAMALLTAELLHRAVERPFMGLGRRLVEPDRRPIMSRRVRIVLAAALVLVVLLVFRHRVMMTFGPRNLARGAIVYASSHDNDKVQVDALTNGELEDEGGAHTTAEDGPWMEVDLGEAMHIGSIRVYNRADPGQDEILPLELLVSQDRDGYQHIATKETHFTEAWPWRIRVKHDRLVRYVRFHVPKNVALTLSEVEVYEQGWMAGFP